jgi:lysophospholipase L1-like esterase
MPAYYRNSNASLPPYAPGRVVFFGDSITEYWVTRFPSEFFPGKPYIGRGIWGQTTGQMIWRFHQDVVALHPEAVVILAGTNDIASHRVLAIPEKNIETMVEMSQHHGLRVVLCSIPPLSTTNPAEHTYDEQRIALFNGWLRHYAAQQHLAFIDYYTALADPSGRMAPSLTTDGIHPSLAGYAVMRPLAQQAIDSVPQP